MHEQAQDITIIQQVLAGNHKAYGILVNRYQNFVFTLVLRYIPSREEAEEVAQDVFVKAYRSIADFRGQSKFSTWLYTIVNTTCISHLRKKRQHVTLIDEEQMLRLPVGNTLTEKGPDATERNSERRMLQQAINKLPEMESQIITLFYQHEQSLDEIGTILGMTPNNVKVKLFRARQKLKTILEQEFTLEIRHL